MKNLNSLIQALACALAFFGVASTANAAMQIYLQGTSTVAPAPVNCGSAAVGSSTLCPTIDFHYSYTDYLNAAGWRNLSTAISNPAEFVVASSTCVLNSTMGGNTVCRVQLRYSPTSGGSHTTSFTLNGQERTYQDNPGANRSYSFTASGAVPVAYDWSVDAWSAWSSSCSANATRVRTVTCMQNGTTPVADSFCTASKPGSSETDEVLTGCTYSWNAGQFGACSGGNGAWAPSDWQPASGCGLTPQTRTVSCLIDVNSGTSTRDVSCVRSDGTAASSELCSGPAPATTQACTPDSTAVCGEEPAVDQSVTLTDGCTGGGSPGGGGSSGSTPKELCTPNSAEGKYCLYLRLQ